MRVIVFFDLPTVTDAEKREYRNFRKLLRINGFVMMQESVYVRMVINRTISESLISTIKRNRPLKGIVQILLITEKQFSTMECITGEFKSDVVDSDKGLVMI